MMIIDNPTNITLNSQTFISKELLLVKTKQSKLGDVHKLVRLVCSQMSLRKATVVATKQSIKVVRNGLLRRLTPSRNDVKNTSVIARPRECSGNPHSLDCFVATKVAPRNDFSLLWINTNRVSYNLDIIV